MTQQERDRVIIRRIALGFAVLFLGLAAWVSYVVHSYQVL